MLFGIAMDLALLGVVYLRLWRDYYFTNILVLVVFLGLGAVLGVARTGYHSHKALLLLPLYEVLLPFILWHQLARFVPDPVHRWAPLPAVVVVGALAYMNGWGFQSGPLLMYEGAALLALTVLVVIWSLRGAFIESELLFHQGALCVLLVLGPAYGLLWPGLGVHFVAFPIAGGVAGALIVAGRMGSSFLNFTVPREVRKRGGGRDNILVSGTHLVGPGDMDAVTEAFLDDLDRGRYGLWVSTEPVAKVKGMLAKGGPRTGEGSQRVKVEIHDRRTEGPLLAAHLTHTSFTENALDPSDSGTLRRSVAEFIKRTGDGVVLLRDGHYLVSNTDIWEMTEVLKFLDRDVPSEGATILMGSDLLARWERSHLEKNGFEEKGAVALGAGPRGREGK